MLKFNYRTLLAFSALLWLTIGIYLISLGSHLVLGTLSTPGESQNKILLVIVSALLIGHLKSRILLRSSIMKQIKRLLSLPNPISFRAIYTPRYWLLLGSMILLGVSMRNLPIPALWRGGINLMIGAALTNGALLYFRYTIIHPSNFKKER